jgi:hypothetical protein
VARWKPQETENNRVAKKVEAAPHHAERHIEWNNSDNDALFCKDDGAATLTSIAEGMN